MKSNLKPLISVVIPSYNHGHLIGRAVASALSQSYPNIEIVVVDNHSSDNTEEEMSRFSDSRIKFLKIHNKGVIAKSRNMGIQAAKGEWVAFLDSDDSWEIDKLEHCSKWFKTSDLVYHQLQLVDVNAKPIKGRVLKSWQVKAPTLKHLLLSGNAIATSSVVVRKCLLIQINGFDERTEIVAAEDYDAWLHIAQITDRFKFIPKVLGFYMLNLNSASRKDMSVPMRIVFSSFAKILSPRQMHQMNANASFAAGRFAYLSGDFLRATKELWLSARWGRFDICVKSVATLGLVWMQKVRKKGE
jgi:glycosyltransferase involved in cell wall biosynthesis